MNVQDSFDLFSDIPGIKEVQTYPKFVIPNRKAASDWLRQTHGTASPALCRQLKWPIPKEDRHKSAYTGTLSIHQQVNLLQEILDCTKIEQSYKPPIRIRLQNEEAYFAERAAFIEPTQALTLSNIR